MRYLTQNTKCTDRRNKDILDQNGGGKKVVFFACVALLQKENSTVHKNC